MTQALLPETVLPPSEESRGQVVDLLEFLRRREVATPGLPLLPPQPSAKLVGPDGSEVVLPSEVHQVLLEVAEALSQGLAVTVAPHQQLLTTQAAAEFLGISRPTLVRLLESDEIPFTKPSGRHRRVRLADLVEYQHRLQQERREGLQQMAREGQLAGLYEATDGPPPPMR